jgi:hypothetical protein
MRRSNLDELKPLPAIFVGLSGPVLAVGALFGVMVVAPSAIAELTGGPSLGNIDTSSIAEFDPTGFVPNEVPFGLAYFVCYGLLLLATIAAVKFGKRE